MNTFWQKLRSSAQTQAAEVIGSRPPWQAKSVWVALGLMLIGGGFWMAESPPATPATPPPGVSSFAESSAPGVKAPAEGKEELKPSSPAMFRFGASYAGGFFLGWAFRRFLKAALLLSGAAVALVALGKKFGWFDLDWTSVETHLRHSLAWLQGEAGAIKQFLTGYLPSAGAAGVGAFLGFRRK